MSTGHEFVEEFYARLGAGDIEGIVAMYDDGAEIVRYDGVADTPEEIADYFTAYLGRNPGFALRSIDQFREADDVVMWDALVDTDNGILQVVHVITRDDDGLIRRHIPGLRGYWGQ